MQFVVMVGVDQIMQYLKTVVARLIKRWTPGFEILSNISPPSNTSHP